MYRAGLTIQKLVTQKERPRTYFVGNLRGWVEECFYTNFNKILKLYHLRLWLNQPEPSQENKWVSFLYKFYLPTVKISRQVQLVQIQDKSKKLLEPGISVQDEKSKRKNDGKHFIHSCELIEK